MTSKNIYIQGIVQGVGFRPFIYQKACQFKLKGFVSNTSKGVRICIDGESEMIRKFIDSIQNDIPKHACIQSIEDTPCHSSGKDNFEIIESDHSASQSVSIPPDIATCHDCLDEMKNPQNRRYQYPFINCTHCGPRFTIIDKLPFDRTNTSMATFNLCDACYREYTNPDDRRFHAQAIACSKCGPSLQLFDKYHQIQTTNPVQTAIQLLKQGKILAIKGLGGFHLSVDACNSEAILKMRQHKHRPDKPFAIMSADIKRIRQYAKLEDTAMKSLLSPQCPIVILEQKHPNGLSKHISGKQTVGVMLPYTPVHHLLTDDFLALIMTSGNLSNQPIVSSNKAAMEKLDFADAFLMHDRRICNPCDDSIVRVMNQQSKIIRRSRGFVPAPIYLKQNLPKVLALGAHLKNTICLVHNKDAYLSQHLGDLTNVGTIQWMNKTIDQMTQLTGIYPDCIACDMHPGYQSTKIAKTMGLPIIAVQHHHAHIASCMAENGINEPVIGIVLDGTGYGEDKTIWGGEVFICENYSYRRVAHLETVPMPAGESSIIYPWKMALSWLVKTYDDKALDIFHHIHKKIDYHSAKIVKQAIDQHIHTPLTSSMGRLFDAVSSLINGCVSITYEGQAAIELENIACDTDKSYHYHFSHKGNTIIHIQPMIKEIIQDILATIDPSVISGKFHTTLICMFTECCKYLQSVVSCKHVVLSGGVFQNKRLFSGLTTNLQNNGFLVSTHSKIPCNDGGISLGQAFVGGLKFK